MCNAQGLLRTLYRVNAELLINRQLGAYGFENNAFPANTYLKSTIETLRCEICSKSTIKTPCRCGDFIVKLEQVNVSRLVT